jgi:hypothetical protein
MSGSLQKGLSKRVEVVVTVNESSGRANPEVFEPVDERQNPR